MNRTLKEATVKRYYYETHDQLRSHLADFISAYNFARRLKTLKGLTPYEHICQAWTKQPDRFILDPIHQMPGLNTYGAELFTTMPVMIGPVSVFSNVKNFCSSLKSALAT
jgi:Integrase core domain